MDCPCASLLIAAVTATSNVGVNVPREVVGVQQLAPRMPNPHCAQHQCFIYYLSAGSNHLVTWPSVLDHVGGMHELRGFQREPGQHMLSSALATSSLWLVENKFRDLRYRCMSYQVRCKLERTRQVSEMPARKHSAMTTRHRAIGACTDRPITSSTIKSQ